MGSVLSTATEALLVVVSPVASMAVKVQVTTSVGLTILGVSWSVFPVEPYTVPLELLHAYDTVGVSPSASMALPEQERRLAVTTPDLVRYLPIRQRWVRCW